VSEIVCDVLVVGTGPAAVASISNLSKGGRKVVVVDAGNPSSSDGLRTPVEGVPVSELKSRDGSFDAYGAHIAAKCVYGKGLSARPSNFWGGFSRVWGGTVHQEVSSYQWPVVLRPKQEDIEILNRLMPRVLVNPNEIGSNSLERVKKAAEENWEFLHSHVAQINEFDHTMQIPSRIGACSDRGREVWSSQTQIERWHRNGQIKAFPGLYVFKISQEGSEVVTLAKDHKEGVVVFRSKRAVLAAGPLGTAQILVGSKIFPSLSICDTPTAFGGFMSYQLHCPKKVGADDSRPQWWMKSAMNPSIFAQIYSPSRLNKSRIAAHLPPGFRFKSVVEALASRTHPVVAYFGDTAAEKIQVNADISEYVSFTPVRSEECRAQFGEQLRGFARILRNAGYAAHLRGFVIAGVGGGYHSGSSLPFPRATTRIGSLYNHDRIHIVDSSVLPHLEAGPMTSLAMVNAVRISREMIAIL
jgi:hypothetical protein